MWPHILALSMITLRPVLSYRSTRTFIGHSSMLFSSVVSKPVESNTSKKLEKLRHLMEKEGIDAFIVPTDDPHMSEYTAPYYSRREFISGFTGSAGTAVITASKAYLWTDGRYHTQAELELDGNWELMKFGLKDVPSPPDFLAKNLKPGAVIGIDPFLHAAGAIKKVEETLSTTSIAIKTLTSNPVDSVWETMQNRPKIPSGAIRVHPLEMAGKTVTEKLSEIRKQMNESHAEALVLTMLDEIAWSFNIRGRDVPCCPVTVAYAIITQDTATLFIDDCKVPTEVRAHLSGNKVDLRPYNDIVPALLAAANKLSTDSSDKAKDNKTTTGFIWFDGKSANQALYSKVAEAIRLDKPSPVTMLKAIKNTVELAGMFACHKRDGAAMAEFFAELEEKLGAGEEVSEVDLDRLSTAQRALGSGYIELSFPTIAGVGSNGAIIHYRAEEGKCKTLSTNDLLLLDSGAQYVDGTTDVTRTIHTGTPTDFQKEIFTRVLKGNIAVDSRLFPAGTAGCLLDSFARQFLWEIGEDFGHGVGHGVGAALNVHEGPHGISRVLSPQPLIPGMIVSNEPGYYLPGEFGVRIENLLVVVEKTDMKKNAGRSFLGFEKLTLIPIQKKLIDVKLLEKKEIDWINNYHARVWEEVSPLLRTDRAKNWLKQSTSPLEV